jgi:hypothetical protein
MNSNTTKANAELTPDQIRAALEATQEHRLAVEAELDTWEKSASRTSSHAQARHEELRQSIRDLQEHEEQLEARLSIVKSNSHAVTD